MCRSFKKADLEIEHRVVLVESSMFRTHSQLELIKQMHDELDEEFKDMQVRLYNAFIAKLKNVIARIERIVEKSVGEDGSTSFSVKPGKSIFVKQCLDSAIDEMERWQIRFDPTWKLLALKLKSSAVDSLLEGHEDALDEDDSTAPSLKATRALRGVVKDGTSSGISVLLPARKLEGMDVQRVPFSTASVYSEGRNKRRFLVDEVELGLEHVGKSRTKALAKDVRDLAEKLQFIESARVGMLQCKGFVVREEGGFRFVFRQPPGTDNDQPPKTLRAMLMSETEHSLTERMNLAKQLSRAVSYVHSLGFVHKNIRPEIIIGFMLEDQKRKLQSVFLTGFGHFRGDYIASGQHGDADWEKNLYRHPNCQGVLPEEEYTMQHDIYSLGVCLLEIGLWKSFAVYDSDEKPSRGKLLSMMIEATGPTTPRYYKEMLVAMARRQLPSRMGDRYCSIVVNCLTCLDPDNEDFSDESQFKDESGIQLGVKYIEKVGSS